MQSRTLKIGLFVFGVIALPMTAFADCMGSDCYEPSAYSFANTEPPLTHGFDPENGQHDKSSHFDMFVDVRTANDNCTSARSNAQQLCWNALEAGQDISNSLTQQTLNSAAGSGTYQLAGETASASANIAKVSGQVAYTCETLKNRCEQICQDGLAQFPNLDRLVRAEWMRISGQRNDWVSRVKSGAWRPDGGSLPDSAGMPILEINSEGHDVGQVFDIDSGELLNMGTGSHPEYKIISTSYNDMLNRWYRIRQRLRESESRYISEHSKEGEFCGELRQPASYAIGVQNQALEASGGALRIQRDASGGWE